MNPVDLPLTIYKGASFSKVLRWGQSRITYRAIQAATKAAPCVLSVLQHGVPDGWPIKVLSCAGMTQLNSTLAMPFYVADVMNADTIELNSVNAIDYTAYAGSGVIAYNQPVNLTGYTARAQLRASPTAEELLLSLTNENGGVVLDVATSTITLVISATATEALDWSAAVYDLELVSAGGQVTPLARGAVRVTKEITR